MSFVKQEEFEALFRSHGSHAQFRYVACFKRVFVLYLLQIHCDAAQKELDGFEFEGSELRVSRLKRPTSSQLLRAPRKRKDFLISPPISPPTDGIVGGSGAVASLALQAAIATLGGLGSSFELHPGSEEQNQPQIIVTQD
eukprot:scpid90954/ scgid0821/ Calcipressin-1; Down syndrome critical region protein 1 homolog; Myocyte-enriched calcineurin-interacting protein 1; Regulator of calcineurin 1